MLNLHFTINGTNIVCSEANQGTLIIPADTVNYVSCNFTFSTDDWANTIKTAYFKNASYERVMQVPIVNGTCNIPWEVLANAGSLLLSVIGVRVNSSTVEYQIPAGPYTMYVHKDVMLDAYPSIPPTPTEYQQFVQAVQDAASTATTKASEASSSAASAVSSASAALGYKNSANTSATDAQTAASQAAGYKNEASASATSAAGYASDASDYSDAASDFAEAAETYKDAAAISANSAASSANQANASKVNAASSATAAATSATSANTSAANAATSATASSQSAAQSASSAAQAYDYAHDADVSRTDSAQQAVYAKEARDSAIVAKNGAISAKDAATAKSTLSESWAVGGTGTREGEDADNAKYYAQQAAQTQVQSNWLETNPISKAYIQNKPVIPVSTNYYTKAEADSIFLTEHQSLAAYRTASSQNSIDAGKANVGDSYTKSESDDKYLTEHQSLSAYRTSSAQDVIDSGKASVSSVTAIESKIPSQATAQNQLADKYFVNSSIATNTANYISNNGVPFTSLAQLEAYTGDVTHNDYAFVTGQDEFGNTYFDRYKASVDYTIDPPPVTWAKEYRLNNSSFTAVQWLAINSAITSSKIATYDAYASAIASKYVKPDSGIPKVDLTSTVQSSLDKADLVPTKQDAYIATNVVISSSDWDANNTCVKSVQGVTASNLVEVSPALLSLSIYSSAGIYATAQGSNSLTFTCSTLPTDSVTAQVVIWR